MIVKRHSKGYWIAQGMGPVRHITCTGATRDRAWLHYIDMCRKQQDEFHENFPMLTISTTAIDIK